MKYGPSLLLAAWMFCTAAVMCADAPKIDKIDPPGWWIGFPNPMLLVHGEGLNRAHFAVQGHGVTLDRMQRSYNGHWAFLWLDIQSATPQGLTITATNEDGQARSSYALVKRSSDAHGHGGFSSADVLYLIMIDRFARESSDNAIPGDDRAAPRGWHGGDLAGIEEHLDYLKQLGITAVWTTPVVSNGDMPESYHGYAATDLYAVDRHFGTVAEYRRLSDALHARGMKFVIDLVPNHIGVRNPWVQDPPAPDWFHGTFADHRPAEHDFYQLTNPHAPPRAWRNITDGWFTDTMPDLNQENPLVASYLIQNALWWVETANLDGIRLDTFPYVDRVFWHDFHATIHSVFPRLTTVGEIFHRAPEVTSFFAGGMTRQGADGALDTGLDTPFDFPLYFALRKVVAHDESMKELAEVLRKDALYPHPERLVSFIGNHDTTRFLTEAGGSVSKLKLALGLLATLRGTPQIYAGDEIGMTGGEDPDNRRDFPGGFLEDGQNAFTDRGRTDTEKNIYAWLSALLALRASHSALQAGLEQNLFVNDDEFAFVRMQDAAGCAPNRATSSRAERLLVVVNKGQDRESFDLSVEDSSLSGCTQFKVLVPAVGASVVVDHGRLHIEEPAEAMTVYEVW